MSIKVIKEPQLFCEDSVGNFVGIFKEGDCIKIKLKDGEKYEGTIDIIFSDFIELDTEKGFFVTKLEDIDEIKEW